MVKINRLLVLGAFGFDDNQLDGQTIKTRNVYDLLKKNYTGKVYYIDTLHIRRNPFFFFLFLFYLIRCKTLVIIPSLNSFTFVFPVAFFLSKLFAFEIIHICVGGWQIDYFLGSTRFHPHPLQLRQSQKIKAFLPEMVTLDCALKNMGFDNTEMFPNFRFLDDNPKQVETNSDFLRLVFMARVDKKKGYDTVFRFAKEVMKSNYRIRIDFYGPINKDDRNEFFSLIDENKAVVSYKGLLQQCDVCRRLEQYDVMLLPTTIYTEGFPGSVLDAYIAGIPIIATEWKYAHEFIEDGKTGFVVPFFEGQEEFNNSIIRLYDDRRLLSQMKKNAFLKRMQFSDHKAWSILSKYV